LYNLQGPDGYPRKVKVADNGDGTFKATYIPDDCGRYKVSVKYGGKEVPHSPFQVQAFATGSVSKVFFFMYDIFITYRAVFTSIEEHRFCPWYNILQQREGKAVFKTFCVYCAN
jgi:hypothetical protein